MSTLFFALLGLAILLAAFGGVAALWVTVWDYWQSRRLHWKIR